VHHNAHPAVEYLTLQASASSFGKRLLSLKDAVLNSRSLMSTDKAAKWSPYGDRMEPPKGGTWFRTDAGAGGSGGSSNAFAQVRQELLLVRGVVVWPKTGRMNKVKSVSVGF
jgi:hypothetical protein